MLERWARGDAEPCTAPAAEAALRRAAERVETALTGLEVPLERYFLEPEPEAAEGRSWYGEPSAAELVEWDQVLPRAGVGASPTRVAQAYLELAVLLRALEGLADRARMGSSPDRGALSGPDCSISARTCSTGFEDLRALAA